MTLLELYKSILKTTKWESVIFVFIIALVLSLFGLKYNYMESVIYAIVLTFATQAGSAQAIARKAIKKSKNIVCDELYLAYDNRFRFAVKTYLISVEGDIISRINCLRNNDKVILEDISNLDLYAKEILLENIQYTLFKLK
ncbi:MAG: hypothetical protein JEZ08_05080 [Clostridiales bacterium]|nr:hypothetical protein [Clostridiales bacterium]